jgi:acid stress-induced BolA-like protein IbaG/YrbA
MNEMRYCLSLKNYKRGDGANFEIRAVSERFNGEEICISMQI